MDGNLIRLGPMSIYRRDRLNVSFFTFTFTSIISLILPQETNEFIYVLLSPPIQLKILAP